MISATKALVKEALTQPSHDEPQITYDSRFTTRGIQLVAGSQKIFCKALIRSNICGSVEPRIATKIKVALTQFAVQALNGSTSTNADVWRGIRDTLTSQGTSGTSCGRSSTTVLKSVTIGAISQTLNTSNVVHCVVKRKQWNILFKCENSPSRKVIWPLAEKLWRLRESSWLEVQMGTVLGAPLIKFKDRNGKPQQGRSRLLTTLLTESAYLIWKLRCAWVVITRSADESKVHSATEIHNTSPPSWARKMTFILWVTNY